LYTLIILNLINNRKLLKKIQKEIKEQDEIFADNVRQTIKEIEEIKEIEKSFLKIVEEKIKNSKDAC
jgi:hypothetical protein